MVPPPQPVKPWEPPEVIPKPPSIPKVPAQVPEPVLEQKLPSPPTASDNTPVPPVIPPLDPPRLPSPPIQPEPVNIPPPMHPAIPPTPNFPTPPQSQTTQIAPPSSIRPPDMPELFAKNPVVRMDESAGYSQSGRPAKSLKFWLLALLVPVLVLIIGLFAYNKIAGGMKLVTFSNDDFSFLVPEKYLKNNAESGVKFDETSGDANSRSFVIALTDPYPRPPTEEERVQLADVFNKQISSLAQGFINSTDEKVEDITSEKTIRDDRDALRVRAKLSKGNKKANLDMLIIFGESAIYVVGVAAHQEDKSLIKHTDTILNSFTSNF